MTTERPPPCKFSEQFSEGGYRGWIEAEVLPGVVKLTEVTTNPNYGGLADMGEYTFAKVLAGEMRTDLPATLVADLQAYVRTLVTALEALLAAVRTVGESNDAADRGYDDAADHLRTAAPERAREAWALAPDALARVLPTLAPLGLGKLDTSRWHDAADRIERVLRRK